MEIQSPRNEDSVIIYSWPTLMERCGEVLQQHSQLKERKMSLCSSSPEAELFWEDDCVHSCFNDPRRPRLAKQLH